MCGIAGIWTASDSEISDREFDRFVDSLAHRGPDGGGVYRDGGLRLGHRRLSILDLSSAASQPLSYHNRYWITFNGEIYNFLELRQELEKAGYAFSTDSDTEVILASYAHWGQACQLKFNGMWAFAIWDRREQTLFLSRDRFGVKPLHYYFDEKIFAFASEMKAFLQLSALNLGFDEEIVRAVLRDSNSLEASESCLIKGLKRLQAGHSMLFTKDRRLIVRKWWETLDHLQEIPATEKEQIEKFRWLLEDACRLRMRSDVPLASALSGGLDSSSILSLVAGIGKDYQVERLSPDWQKAFIALYPGTSQDERIFADEVINRTQATPYYVEVDAARLVQYIDEALYQMEEIFDVPIGPWLLYREFRKKGVVISLDGHGGDELLGGYHHQVQEAMSLALFPQMNCFQFMELKKALKGLYFEGTMHQMPTNGVFLKKILKNALSSSPKVHHFLKTIFQSIRSEQESHWLRPGFGLEKAMHFSFSKQVHDKLDSINSILYRDFHQRTLPTILRNFDRCSMAHGVEIRAPFLDWRLVCYAFSLPPSVKIKDGYTKWILREAMKGILPESIRTRQSKIGFASPTTEWFKTTLKSFILDQVNSSSFLSSSIWDGPKIRDFTERCYATGDFAGARRCWEFVQADRLMQLFRHSLSSV